VSRLKLEDGPELYWEERGEGPDATDGFVSRPDQSAAVVRRINAASRAAAGRP
jgi:hypothetical protein